VNGSFGEYDDHVHVYEREVDFVTVNGRKIGSESQTLEQMMKTGN
jgi:hypothetical protein